jgi:hypothetical protein
MRRLIVGLVVTATTLLVPFAALAGNQQIADNIAKDLRDSGQLQHYKIGVKYEEGTAWLRGFVANQQQMAVALNLVAGTEGVERVVNELQIGQPVSPTPTPAKSPAPRLTANPLAALKPGAVKSASISPKAQNRVHTADLSSAPLPRQPLLTKTQPLPEKNALRLTQNAQPARSMQTLGRLARASQPSLQTPDASLARAPVPSPQAASQSAPRRTKLSAPQHPLPVAFTQPMAQPVAQPMPQPMAQPGAAMPGGPIPAYVASMAGGVAPARYDQPHMPNYSWPSYAAYPNYAALTYPRQYSPSAWPYIGPFYPYPQVPLGWRKVTLEWDDGWWMLDFKDSPRCSRW